MSLLVPIDCPKPRIDQVVWPEPISDGGRSGSRSGRQVPVVSHIFMCNKVHQKCNSRRGRGCGCPYICMSHILGHSGIYRWVSSAGGLRRHLSIYYVSQSVAKSVISYLWLSDGGGWSASRVCHFDGVGGYQGQYSTNAREVDRFGPSPGSGVRQAQESTVEGPPLPYCPLRGVHLN